MKTTETVREAIRSIPPEEWDALFDGLIKEQQAKVDETISANELTKIPIRVTMMKVVKSQFATISKSK